MKRAIVNGEEISQAKVDFELDRLMVFYKSHSMSSDEIRNSLNTLREKALEQAIGAKLLLDESKKLDMPLSAIDIDNEIAKVIAQVGGEENLRKMLAQKNISEEDFRKHIEDAVRVNKLVSLTCSEAEEPEEEEVESFYQAHKSEYAPKTLVDVQNSIKDLLRHRNRGRALQSLVEELKASSQIKYIDDDLTK
ncbi:MAG: SurA N-terminal domain-containing protein [Kiritimatiellae bacterium]|nr:SurA N-terminal domain-containing protein [Kiritimatiellia bacterium]